MSNGYPFWNPRSGFVGGVKFAIVICIIYWSLKIIL